MMDEISKGFFWIPDFRHIFPIFDRLYWRPFVFRFTFLSMPRKFAPPANLPGKGSAEEVVLYTWMLAVYLNTFLIFDGAMLLSMSYIISAIDLWYWKSTGKIVDEIKYGIEWSFLLAKKSNVELAFEELKV
jgi:hypothetical protein